MGGIREDLAATMADLGCALRGKGLKESVAPADFTRSSGDEFLCPDCGDVFPTLKRLKCHRGKAHKVPRPTARFVRDGVCPHCRVNFHCRTRTTAHLEKGERSCREALKGLLPELTEEELREADTGLLRHRRQARSEGVCRMLDSWRCQSEVRCGLEHVFHREFVVTVDTVCRSFRAQ